MDIISVIRPILHIVERDEEGWYKFHEMRVKNCISIPLASVVGQFVAHKENKLITGKLIWGIKDSKWVYVYWDRIPSTWARPTALVNINDLLFTKAFYLNYHE